MTMTNDLAPTAAPTLSLARLYAMRGGYLLMGLGLALVKWPKLLDVHHAPVSRRHLVSAVCDVAAGVHRLRYPVKLLPVLLFEATWKVVWFAIVALPQSLEGGLDSATSDIAVNCSLVVVIIAVIPWRYAWNTFADARGDRLH